ncbi:hypothetical protein [Streptomyces showdoensis]|uniref:hypothetical protein n=1 Tax=Streptomyces showdoensis TaxID=68268 RepID=UPI001F0B5C35|nr:hypothetical protein [Streptomyces showdoensis]
MKTTDRRTKIFVAAAALALLALSATGCTEGAAKGAAPSGKASAKASAPAKAAGVESEQEQGQRAKAALEPLDPDEMLEPNGPRFVESGLDRVVEGVHHLSRLKAGKDYQVFVACVGKGTVKIVLAGQAPRTAACDGRPVGESVRNAPEELRLDITAVGGATGMVAWQLHALTPDGGTRVQ